MKLILPSLLIAVLFAGLKILSAIYFLPSWILLLAACFLVAAYYKPVETICVLLMFLPLFGNRPGTIQAEYFDVIVSGVIIGSIRHFSQAQFDNRLIQMLGLFSLGSIFSLTGLPILDLTRNFENFFAFGTFVESITSIHRFFQFNEFNPFYSFKSVVYTCFAFYLGLVIFLKSKNNLLVLQALFFAGIHSIFFGLLNYYNLISLDWLRGLDPVVNPSGQFRMQSYFGHSGWFAEFITLVAPFSMVILLLKGNFSKRLFYILAIMIVTEYALILTYQRGGWLSYPITVFAIWIAIYYFYQRQKNQEVILSNVIKTSAFKIILSVPLTILISLLIINLVAGNSGIISAYKERLANVSQAEDRLAFVRIGYKLGLLHPFLGGGAESFGYAYDREVVSPAGRYYGSPYLALHGTAHNFYLQIFSGRGIFGVVCFLSACILIIQTSLRIIKKEKDVYKLVFNLTTVCFVFAFIIYGNVQEFFYIQILQVCCFIILCNYALEIEKKSSKKINIIFVALLLAHLGWEFVLPGNNSKYLQRDYGMFAPVKNSRWCGRNVGYASIAKNGIVELKVRGVHKNQKIIVNSRFGEQVFDLSKDFSSIKYQIPKSYNGELLMNLKSNYYITPAINNKKSKDTRILSFELRE